MQVRGRCRLPFMRIVSTVYAQNPLKSVYRLCVDKYLQQQGYPHAAALGTCGLPGFTNRPES